MALLSQEDSVLMVIDMQGNLYESMQDKQFLMFTLMLFPEEMVI